MADIKLVLRSETTTNGYDVQIWASSIVGTSPVDGMSLYLKYNPLLSTYATVVKGSTNTLFQPFIDTSTLDVVQVVYSSTGDSLNVTSTEILVTTVRFNNTVANGATDFVGSLTNSTVVQKLDPNSGEPVDYVLDTLPTIDTVEAAVSQIAITDATGAVSGLLNAADTVIATVTANKAVTVDTTNGTPTLKLDVGGFEKTAAYSSGSGSSSLLFTYTVQSGDTDANGIGIGANALALNGGTIKDGANNNAIITSNEVAANSSYKVDTIAPTATIALADSALLVGDTTTATITFSEAVTGFANSDLAVQGGTLSAVTSTDGGITWTGTFTPTANLEDATNVVTMASTYTDVAGNAGTSATSANYVIDLKAPITPTIVFADTALKAGETSLVTLTFSEAVSSFSNADLAIAGGTLTIVASTDGGVTWTATFTPTADLEDTTNVVTLANTYNDVAGNTGVNATSANYTIDTVRPEIVSITPASLNSGNSQLVTITLNEAVTNFAVEDIASKIGTIDTGSFTKVSDTVYTILLSATEAISDVANNFTFTTDWADAAGNQPVFGPTVAITFSDVALQIGDTSTVTFTFSATPKNTDGTDITAGNINSLITSVENCTLGAFTKVSDTVYTTTLTPTTGITDTTNKITVGTNWKNAANLPPTGTTNSQNYAVDTFRPIATITSDKSTLKRGETATITFTFTEDPGTSFIDGDIVVTGGTIGTLSGTGLTRTATFTPAQDTASANASITVATGTYTDAAGNTGGAGITPSIAIDTVAPTLTINSDKSAVKVGETATITFAFSEDPDTTFIAGDIVTIGGTLGALSGTGLTRTATFTPTQDTASANASITVASGVYTDAAGNSGGAGITPSISIDTVAPTLTINSDKSAVKVGETATITFTFSEDPGTTFIAGDIVTAGGTLGALSGTGITKTAIFTPTADLASGNASITVASGNYTDAAGNTGGAGITPSIAIDTVRPTLTVTPATTALSAGQTTTITITMSEAVTGFAADDIKTSSKYSISNFTPTSATVYTATYSATEVTTDVAKELKFETNWADAAGNQPVFGPTVAITFSDDALKNGDTSTVTFTFSAAPKNTDGTDITAGNINALITSVENGALGAFTKVSDIVYTATLTPASGIIDTTNKITVGTNWKDAANLPPTGTTDSPNYVVDTFRPTATIFVADTALKAGETTLVTITFSEAVTGFDNSDLIIANGLLSNVVSTNGGTTWTATLTPTADITDASNVITLANTGVTDIAGNVGAGTTDSNNYAIDTKAPTATIVVADTALKAGETSLVTITFSEAVTSFDNADLTVQNGTLTNVASSDGGVTWTATLTPTASIEDTTNVITLANTGVTDASGNAGAGATDSNNYVIDTLAPAAPALVEEPSSDLTDSRLNSAEAVTTIFRVTLPASGSTAVVGDSVELLLGGVSFSTAKKVTLDATAVNTNRYVDFTVVKADLGVDGAKALTSKITDIAGNVGAASSAVSFTLDTTAPSNTISGIGVASGNTSVNATLSAGLLTGETLWAAIGSNGLVEITPTSVSGKTIAWATTVPAGYTTVKFEVRDLAGNATSISAEVTGTTTTTTSTITDPVVGTTLTAPDGNPLTAAPLVTGASNEQILLAAMPSGLSLIVKEIADSTDTSLLAKLNDSLDALPTSEVNVSAVQAGIDSYLATLSSVAQANVVVRSIEFPSSTALLSAPAANQLVINGSTAGNEALVIDTRNLPDGSVLDLQDVEFAIIIGENVTIRGGAGSNIVYAGSGHQDIRLGVLDDTIYGGAGDDDVASTSGDDYLYGDDGKDSVSGGADNDHLYGGTGNDTLNGEAGNDMLDGGADSDTALFSGNFTDYTITFNGVSYTITDNNSIDGVDDGTDIVTNVEFFQFANGTYPQDSIIPADPYESHEGSGRPSPEAAFTGIGVLGILSWVLF